MQSILPQGKLAATRINPRISLFYGVPKVGKTTMMAQLPNHLLLDFERGSEALEAARVPIGSIDGPTVFNEDGSVAFTSVHTVIQQITAIGIAEFQKTGKKPKPPYKYLIVDTVDKLEELCEGTATRKYKESVLGKKFEGNSVLELPNGGGYYYLRNEVMEYVNQLAAVCEHLILVSHVREKNLDKGGIAVEVRDISLTGKLGKIVCAKADVIGYMYQDSGTKKLMVSFETYESSVMGARFPRLAGQRFPFDWDKIFLPEPTDDASTVGASSTQV
jgi:hypothetical protein